MFFVCCWLLQGTRLLETISWEILTLRPTIVVVVVFIVFVVKFFLFLSLLVLVLLSIVVVVVVLILVVVAAAAAGCHCCFFVGGFAGYAVLRNMACFCFTG